MALKRLKTKTSKRVPARQKYKILKKIREHHRKKNKAAKKSGQGKSKKQKLIQIPNVCPFKDEILKDVAEYKKLEKAQEIKRKEMSALSKCKTLETITEEANQLEIAFSEKFKATSNEKDYKQDTSTENSLKAYFKEFKKVVDAADVMLEIVDARDPIGTRCPEVENAVKNAAGSKRLVLILNKADLVPRDNLNKWIKYFRRFGPVAPFKSSTQNQTSKLGRRKISQVNTHSEMQNSVCIGAELLMSMLANYSRNKGIKTAIQVGVAGIPNVGKSSIINSLARSKVCSVGCAPGVTRSMQQVELDSKIKLIDCPGIVFSKTNSESTGDLSVLLNAQRVGDIKDPFSVAEKILMRGTKEYFCKLYDVTKYETYEEFFAKKALRMGKLLPGGIADAEAAARSILNDWISGKIKYCTEPPEEKLPTHLSASIVNYDAKEFEFEDFDLKKDELVMQFEENQAEITMEVDRSDVKKIAIDESEMQLDETVETNPKKRKLDTRTKKVDPQLMIQGNQSINKNMKVQRKKDKKNKARTERKVSNVSDVLERFSM